MSSEITKSIAAKESSREILRLIYLDTKAKNPKVSLQFLSNKLRISSKSYFSDVMSGRRKFSVKYVKPLSKVLDLEPLIREFLLLTVEIENNRNKEQINDLRSRLELLRSIMLANKKPTLHMQDLDLFTIFEVFCFIGSESHGKSVQDIQKHFAKMSARRLEAILKKLQNQKAIQMHDDRYSIVENLIIFKTVNASKDAKNEFLRSSIQRAEEGVEHWCHDSQRSYFQSMIFGVSDTFFRERLPEIRLKMNELLAEIANEQGAEQFIHFNIQVFPTNHSQDTR